MSTFSLWHLEYKMRSTKQVDNCGIDKQGVRWFPDKAENSRKGIPQERGDVTAQPAATCMSQETLSDSPVVLPVTMMLEGKQTAEPNLRLVCLPFQQSRVQLSGSSLTLSVARLPDSSTCSNCWWPLPWHLSFKSGSTRLISTKTQHMRLKREKQKSA